MPFKDRKDAGKELAKALEIYRDRGDCVIVALPRGGVVVGCEAAKTLHLPLEIVSPRKLGAPFNPELAIGAITEVGEKVLNEILIEQLGITDDYIEKISQIEEKRARERIKEYRGKLPKRNLEGKTAILVDDGIATGYTMRAAIKTVRKEGAREVVVAVPVAPPDTVDEFEELADRVICVEMPPFFGAVGNFYYDFSQVDDKTVIELMKESSHESDGAA